MFLDTLESCLAVYSVSLCYLIYCTHWYSWIRSIVFIWWFCTIVGHVVAFYAFLSQSDNTPGQHHTVIFDTEITNIGSAYSPNTGVFTAPMTGVFVFNWNLYSGYRGDLVSNLMVNSDNKGDRRSDNAIVDEDHSSSGCVVVALNQGDEVYVITHSTHSIKGPIISYPRLYESSFSGWLLAWEELVFCDYCKKKLKIINLQWKSNPCYVLWTKC